MNQPDACDSIPRLTSVFYERCIYNCNYEYCSGSLQRRRQEVEVVAAKESAVSQATGAESTAVILKFSVKNVAAAGLRFFDER
jgi:hypothetical protein